MTVNIGLQPTAAGGIMSRRSWLDRTDLDLMDRHPRGGLGLSPRPSGRPVVWRGWSARRLTRSWRRSRQNSICRQRTGPKPGADGGSGLVIRCRALSSSA